MTLKFLLGIASCWAFLSLFIFTSISNYKP